MGRLTLRIAAMAASVVAAAGLAATPSHAAPLTGGDVSKSAYVSGPAAAPAGVKDLRRFWTAERMRAATPARAPVGKSTAATTAATTALAKPTGPPRTTEPRLPSRKAITAAARAAGADVSAQAVLNITVGKAFFYDPIDGKEHRCSGATVNSGKRRLVITAGHCVSNGFGLWMQGFVFAPAYDNGAPFGYWVAAGLAARTDWVYGGLPAGDVGVAIMDGTPIVDVVGGNGLSWNQQYGAFTDVFGYPTGGETQGTCAGNLLPGLEANQVGMFPCDHWSNGSSGSPMLQSYGLIGPGLGYVNSVVSTVYTPITDHVYGPYFDDVNAGLLYYAETISP
jgi:V8-like Glu-specific endopeptidase